MILTDPSYYTVPTLEQCDQAVAEDGSCVVQGFTVGRRNLGEIQFSGKTDVRGLNLDRIGKAWLRVSARGVWSCHVTVVQ